MAPLIKVVLADDHPIWRDGVRSDLGDGFWVVAEAGTAEEAIAAIRAHKPDVAVCDLQMPGGGRITDRRARARVIGHIVRRPIGQGRIGVDELLNAVQVADVRRRADVAIRPPGPQVVDHLAGRGRRPAVEVAQHFRVAVEFDQEVHVVRGEPAQDQPLGLQKDLARTPIPTHASRLHLRPWRPWRLLGVLSV